MRDELSPLRGNGRYRIEYIQRLQVMKIGKYVLAGLLAGIALSLLAYVYRRRGLKGTEFEEFLESSAVADDLFGRAFRELPDKL
jgi:hypothetical protein